MDQEQFEMAMAQSQSEGPGIVPMIIALAFGVFMLASMWKIFTKAGQPGWACIVPIYNIVVLCKVAGKPAWWTVLFFIPIVSFVASILVSLGVAQQFGKGVGFGLGLVFLGPIFYPILAFGSAQYSGSAA